MEHTAGPWEVGESFTDDIAIRETSPDNECVAITLELSPSGANKANAEFIVRACNSHDELLEACHLILDRMDLGRVASRGINRVKSYEIKGKRGENIKDIIQLFKRAIAKAERKEV